MRAAELEGFLFFQGMEPSPATAVKTMPPGSSLEQMAEAAKEAGAQGTAGHVLVNSAVLMRGARLGAKAAHKFHVQLQTRPCRADTPSLGRLFAGAQAFTTGGAIFRSLPLQEDWRRASLDPREGMYVTAAAARAMQLDEKPAAPGARSPRVRGA